MSQGNFPGQWNPAMNRGPPGVHQPQSSTYAPQGQSGYGVPQSGYGTGAPPSGPQMSQGMPHQGSASMAGGGPRMPPPPPGSSSRPGSMGGPPSYSSPSSVGGPPRGFSTGTPPTSYAASGFQGQASAGPPASSGPMGFSSSPMGGATGGFGGPPRPSIGMGAATGSMRPPSTTGPPVGPPTSMAPHSSGPSQGPPTFGGTSMPQSSIGHSPFAGPGGSMTSSGGPPTAAMQKMSLGAPPASSAVASPRFGVPSPPPSSHGGPVYGQQPAPPAMNAGGSFQPRGPPQTAQSSYQTGAPAPQQGQPSYMGGAPQQMPPMPQQQPAALSDAQKEAQCEARFMRMSANSIPGSKSLAEKAAIPMGVLIQPLANDENGENTIDIVDFGNTGIVRCTRCRTYINPFVQWIDNGRRWRCNICAMLNNVPSSYFSHLDENGLRRDRHERPELSKGSVEFVAPAEYMVRPPQAPVYVFVIDVSVNAIQTGMLQTVCDTVKSALDDLPGAPRTQVGIITFNSTVHYYNLKSTLNSPQMLIVPDVNDLFIPIPDDLLVNLSESRDQVETLLEQLPSIHKNSKDVESCLGPAKRAAFRVMAHIGGKMCIFQTQLPTLGEGSLKHRENPRLFGTDKEHTLFHPAEGSYRHNAVEFSRLQVSVDLFLFAHQYADVATLACLPKYTSGQLYFYPGFTAETHGEKFRKELIHDLTRTTAWESVMRVRCTRGLSISEFHGNYYIRGQDLLALPNCSSDSVFGLELVHNDAVLSASVISVQAALLYTTSEGERRIRVHNIAAPVTSVLGDMFRTADIDTLCNVMAKKGLDVAVKSGMAAARDYLQDTCVGIVRAYKSSMGGYGGPQSHGQQLLLPESLQLFPLYTMALQKNAVFKGGTDVHSDERVFLMYALKNMSVEQSKVFIYPRLFALHNMGPECGDPCNESDPAKLNDVSTAGPDKIVLPPVTNLSVERLSSDGAFLLEDSICMCLWLGRMVSDSFLYSVFGIRSLDGADLSKLNTAQPTDGLGKKVHNIINALKENRPTAMRLEIIREGDPVEARFFWKLVEDRANFAGGSFSYAEFLGHINRRSFGMR